MSRIGRMSIKVPDKVKVITEPGLVKVEGPKGKVQQKLDASIRVILEKGEIRVERPDDTTRSRELHGLSRTLVNNMILGVTTGFSRSLEINGVGYKAALAGKNLQLSLGYSHDVTYAIPAGILIVAAKPTELTISGIDKRQVGQVAAEIRAYRGPEPYKGKGVKYAGEFIFRKEGKKK